MGGKMDNTVETLQESLRQLFQQQHTEWRKIVAGLTTEALNWEPGDETNSLGALVAHTFESERFLMAMALGIKIDRERDVQFKIVVSETDELLELIDETEADVEDYIDQITDDSLVSEHTALGRTHTGAHWSLLALAHSREHLGQAFLTRQMYEQSI
jgi:hypothetical protein